MATFSKSILSGSTDGCPIAVSATASPGTTIHTGPSNAAFLHEVWLYASTYSTTPTLLTVQMGNTDVSKQVILSLDYGSGLLVVIPGLIIKGNASPLVIRAFATVTDTVNISGYVNVIS